MPALSFDGVLVIALVAVAVPVVLGLAPRLPTVRACAWWARPRRCG
jgi:hypothetical protein